jgi:hypothetical protein
MIGRTATVVARGLLLACLLAAAQASLRRGGDRPPIRLPCSETKEMPLRLGLRCASDDSSVLSPGNPPGPGVEGVHDARKTLLFFPPMRPSPSFSRRLDYIGDTKDNHAAHENSVYAAVHQRTRRWSLEPVTSPPPLLSDRPHGEHTYIKTKLYPHVSF